MAGEEDPASGDGRHRVASARRRRSHQRIRALSEHPGETTEKLILAAMKTLSRSPQLNRRELLKGGVALPAMAFAQYPLSLFGGPAPEEGAVLIPFLDAQPSARKQTRWQELERWFTKTEDLYVVSHYNTPSLNEAAHTLEVSGLVRKPRTFTLDEIKKRRRRTVTATLECGGNSNSPGFMGAIGNIRCTGASLRDLLDECAPLRRGIEVVFFGADERTETIRKKDYPQNFARSLHINDARRDDLLLCYELNGEPLTKEHGFPLRLIVPGWFGISWVKWLNRHALSHT